MRQQKEIDDKLEIDSVIPKSLDEFQLNEYLSKYFKSKIDDDSLLNMYLFYGEPGTGKRTFVNLINNEINKENKEFKLVEVDRYTPVNYLQTVINNCLADKLKVIFVSDEEFINIPGILRDTVWTFYFNPVDEEEVKNICTRIFENYAEPRKIKINNKGRETIELLSSLFLDNLRTPLNLLEYYQDLDFLNEALKELKFFKEKRLENENKIIECYLNDKINESVKYLEYFSPDYSRGVFFEDADEVYLINDFDKFLENYIDDNLKRFLEEGTNEYSKLDQLKSVIKDLTEKDQWSEEYLYKNCKKILEEAYNYDSIGD